MYTKCCVVEFITTGKGKVWVACIQLILNLDSSWSCMFGFTLCPLDLQGRSGREGKRNPVWTCCWQSVSVCPPQ
jgi:hypothetical protein